MTEHTAHDHDYTVGKPVSDSGTARSGTGSRRFLVVMAAIVAVILSCWLTDARLECSPMARATPSGEPHTTTSIPIGIYDTPFIGIVPDTT